VSSRKLLVQLTCTLQFFYECTRIYHWNRKRERERERTERYSGEGDAGAKRGDSLRTSRLHRAAHAQLTIVREKNLPSKFCATAHEARGSCSSRALDRESGGDIVVIAKESNRGRRGRDGKRGRPYWMLSLCIVFQRVSTPSSYHLLRFSSFYPRLPSLLSSVSSAAFLSPSA